MTLGRLIELYQAEQEGKQIMVRVHHFGCYEHINEVKIIKVELKDLIIDEEDTSCTFFIKNEEDENGNKIK